MMPFVVFFNLASTCQRGPWTQRNDLTERQWERQWTHSLITKCPALLALHRQNDSSSSGLRRRLLSTFLVHHVSFGRAGQRPYASRHRPPTKAFARSPGFFLNSAANSFTNLFLPRPPCTQKRFINAWQSPVKQGSSTVMPEAPSDSRRQNPYDLRGHCANAGRSHILGIKTVKNVRSKFGGHTFW